MAIKLYRRHRKECEGGHVEDSRMREFEEGRRGWKKCGCLIHVSGTLGQKFNCKQIGKADWDEAKAIAAEFCLKRKWLTEDIAKDLQYRKDPPSRRTRRLLRTRRWIVSMPRVTRSAGLLPLAPVIASGAGKM
jgi:hypothetical protein